MIDFPIPYGKQDITQADIDAVVRTLKSDYLTQGPEVLHFEKAFADYVGSKYAVAVSNGTAALHLNAMALGVQPGDKVITTPITFAATANCVRYCGAEVVFADIDPKTYLLDVNEVRNLLISDLKREIKGIIPVDFAGRSVDMEVFRELADKFGCWIIEDACHAPGAFFENQKNESVRAGSGQYADLAIFSFHPVKHIAAGEGGMVTTNNIELYQKLLELRSHGITRNEEEFQNSKELAMGSSQSETIDQWPGWYMEMQSLGYNYRISDINCALGMSQLRRADVGLKRRKKIAQKYNNAFRDSKYIIDRNVEVEGTNNGHAYHLYVIEVGKRYELYNHLRENQIFSQVHYIPTHLMPYYQQLGWEKGQLPHAESYYGKCLSLPMYPTLTDKEQAFVIQTILDFYEG